jgi:hypothetical protein
MRSEVQVAAQPACPDDAIPKIARTRGGVVFDPSQDRWAYREGVKLISLEFAGIPSLSPRMRSSIKKALLWYAENSSPSHLQNMHSHFLRLAECLASSKDRVIDEITDLDVLNYKASLPADRAWYLGALSGFLKKWHRLGFPSVSSSAVGLLHELRLKGNPHGIAVLTMDPFVGPFTSIEQEALQGFVNEAFAQGILDEEVYFLAWLFMALGARPAQYAALKVCDLRKDVASSGEVTFVLKVPRANSVMRARVSCSRTGHSYPKSVLRFMSTQSGSNQPSRESWTTPIKRRCSQRRDHAERPPPRLSMRITTLPKACPID